ncbi:hypothetical protein DCC39_00740 [Pueribacillus theae]|uniref:VWA domain-containing protein n=1 Tax=Pueribacillus theae TaxID=2171751 RepID=A0A2U1K7E9_9BACI|nr:VWA domain-containing protein [Pueribacillus theae]PWA13450.1 hypothetical protein DCC39_00740 [Pueribacillus theae]
MRGKLVDLCSSLRLSGVPVSIPESLEAASVVTDLEKGNVEDRETIRLFLQATMLKDEKKASLFNEQFERWWMRWYGASKSGYTLPDILQSLEKSILKGDKEEIEQLFNMAIDRFKSSAGEGGSGISPDKEHGAEGIGHQSNPLKRFTDRRALYYDLRKLLNFEELSHKIAQDADMSLWHQQNAKDSLNQAEAFLRKTVFNSGYSSGDRNVWRIRTRIQEKREDVSDLSISKATFTQFKKMQEIVPDIVRKLSYRKKYKDHDQKGILQLRKTMRSSLSNGGVPIDVIFKRKTPKKERIAILCDLSGSVEIFSQFALQLANCFSSQFAGVKCYGFISDIDDITRFVSREDFPHSMKGLYSESNLVLGSGNSDYGQVFGQFVEKHLPELARSSSVLILGDARNNGRDPGLDAFKAIRNWVKKVYWLNPEPTSSWGSGDSVMSQYAELCDSAHYIESVNDLAKFLVSLRGN